MSTANSFPPPLDTSTVIQTQDTVSLTPPGSHTDHPHPGITLDPTDQQQHLLGQSQDPRDLVQEPTEG